eukprot:CAMPEP_0197247290 /NCGR_PEP_ID=MMETSP1429-20130617/28145_1 /TAXON_ID=49237 /ORGANISM="Chaetoceros  sp., Strain UNC1202" /LENGTH=165 /DNA_ID=CAMNT_0042708169 /DNA_START=69 /DNA_END=566 /DNA_ORIENTATION=+
MSLSRRSAFPTDLFSGFDDFFSTPFPQDIATLPVPFLTNVDRDPDMILRRSSPCYEITENDKQFQLAIDVPGVKLSDINIELQQDRCLCVSGGRKMKNTNQDGKVSMSESRFEKRFVVDENVDTSKMTANLQDGVLTVFAPKNLEVTKVQKIPITGGAGANPQGS